MQMSALFFRFQIFPDASPTVTIHQKDEGKQLAATPRVEARTNKEGPRHVPSIVEIGH